MKPPKHKKIAEKACILQEMRYNNLACWFRNTKLKVYYSETGAGDGARTDDDARPPRRAAAMKADGCRSMRRAP